MRWILITALLLLVVGVREGTARGPRGIFRRSRLSVLHRYQRPATYDERRQYLNWRYPKYVGGFHAAYFRDLGLPPGDVGLRGNGLYMTPW